MPYLRCLSCRIRVAEPAQHRDCPSCGEPLEAAAQLTDLVGFRTFNAFAGAETLARAEAASVEPLP